MNANEVINSLQSISLTGLTRVVHDDAEHGLTDISIRVCKVVDKAYVTADGIEEANYNQDFDQEAIEFLKRDIQEHLTRDYEAEHAESLASNLSTYEELKAEGLTGENLDIWLTMTPPLEEYLTIQ